MKNLNLFLQLFDFYPNMQILEVGEIDKEIRDALTQKLNRCDGNLEKYEGELERGFEYAILSNIEVTEEALKNAYLKLEATGNLIILIKKSSADVWMLKDLIGECGFTAVNDIDIFDEYDLITANKHEMWARAY